MLYDERSSNKGSNNITLIKFSAKVMMGTELYTELTKD
tara:strand:+ start:540 stop:653 length:114 start_codon:yes stop_codon:yes gene_type:complete